MAERISFNAFLVCCPSSETAGTWLLKCSVLFCTRLRVYLIEDTHPVAQGTTSFSHGQVVSERIATRNSATPLSSRRTSDGANVGFHQQALFVLPFHTVIKDVWDCGLRVVPFVPSLCNPMSPSIPRWKVSSTAGHQPLTDRLACTASKPNPVACFAMEAFVKGQYCVNAHLTFIGQFPRLKNYGVFRMPN